VQDNDRPAVVVEVPKDLVDQLPIGMVGRLVRCGRSVQRRELDLDDAPSAFAGLIKTRIDRKSAEPGFEPIGISKLREIPPSSDQRLLDRVACELGVPKDEAGGFVQPHDRRASELREGVMVASTCPLDELSLVHRRLTLIGTTVIDRASQGMAFASRFRFFARSFVPAGR
jgi:hypothetical protein